jgi:membrane protein YdbS with pleckstrin-like domain
VEEREQTDSPAPVPPSTVPSIVDGEEHPVDPRSVRVARIIAVPVILLISMVPLILITIGWATGGIPSVVYLPLLGGLLTIVGLLLGFTYAWTAARHRHLRYRVDDKGLRIRRGVFWRKVILIPTSRVQHTDVSQGPVQRSFELAALTVHTAGTEGASISLAGLEHGIATRLCDHLQPEPEADAD